MGMLVYVVEVVQGIDEPVQGEVTISEELNAFPEELFSPESNPLFVLGRTINATFGCPTLSCLVVIVMLLPPFTKGIGSFDKYPGTYP
ncbi:MAG: hypothetical protein BWY67_01950 [Bacteroidetes bacterium ADurb.Bin397]|nr:MAG: hypothetical protein BWY67_01950 [Bacteroidetes bacterium ADurb.Bin397]